MADTRTTASTPSPPIAAGRGPLRIEFLYLDLETCTRCRGTDRRLNEALDVVRHVLSASGAEVEVSKVHVETAEHARELRFLSSPTIRVNGRDIALELRESSCGSEACTDGCGDSIACRVWVHRGQEYTEPPVAMISDAILREVYGGEASPRDSGSEPYELPENLKRFFAEAAERDEAACCSATEQRSCCEAEDKAECCGSASGGSCGCR